MYFNLIAELLSHAYHTHLLRINLFFILFLFFLRGQFEISVNLIYIVFFFLVKDIHRFRCLIVLSLLLNQICY